MCVIAYQRSNQPLLTFREVEAMAKRNPHGMGYMANLNGKIVYKKGFFDVDEFYSEYLNLRRNKDLVDIALHFRIGTGSDINIAMCHPFPITSNPKRIKSTSGSADVCVMMNGIIGKSTKEFSDTALYIMDRLKPYYDSDSRFFLDMTRRQRILFNNEIYGNRFIFMSKDGTALFGEGWSNYEGKAEVSNRYWISLLDFNYDIVSVSDKEFAPTPQKYNRYRSYIDRLIDGDF